MEIFIYLIIIIGVIYFFILSSASSKDDKPNNLRNLKPNQSKNKSEIKDANTALETTALNSLNEITRKSLAHSNNHIVNILKSKGITKLYHVTSLKNWKSIQSGGYTV